MGVLFFTAAGASRANTRRSPNVGLMLVQRRRRWADIKATLGQHDQRLVLAGSLPSITKKVIFITSLVSHKTLISHSSLLTRLGASRVDKIT